MVNHAESLVCRTWPIAKVNKENKTPQREKNTSASRFSSPDQLHLRWDKADLNSYYFYTGHYLQPYFSQLEDAVKSCDNIPYVFQMFLLLDLMFVRVQSYRHFYLQFI